MASLRIVVTGDDTHHHVGEPLCQSVRLDRRLLRVDDLMLLGSTQGSNEIFIR